MFKERLNFLEGLESAIKTFLRFPYENAEETIVGLECMSVTELKNIRDSIENINTMNLSITMWMMIAFMFFMINMQSVI